MQPLFDNLSPSIRGGVPRIDWANPLTDGLIALWKLDGFYFGDLTGRGNALTPTSCKPAVTPVGSAVKLDGSSSWLAGPISTSLFPANVTLVVRFTRTNIGTFGDGTLCGVDFSSSGYVYGLSYHDGSTPYVLSGCYTGSFFTTAEVSLLSAPAVNIAALTYSAASKLLSCYLNGVIGGTATASGALSYPTPDSSHRFNFGLYGAGQAGPFAVDFCAIWNRALSAAEIAMLGADPTLMLVFPDDDLFASIGSAAAGFAVTINAGGAVELLGSVRTERAAVAEGLPLVRGDLAAAAEGLRMPRIDVAGASELLAARRFDGAAALELAAAMRSDGAVASEWSGALAVSADAPLGLEMLASVRSEGVTGAEASAGVRGDEAGPAEWASGFAVLSSASVAVEAVSGIGAMVGTALEWLGTFVPALVANPLYIVAARVLRFIAAAAPRRYTARAIPGMAQSRDLFPPIDADVETLAVTFDFAPMLASGVTITAVVEVTCALYGGSDESPSSRLIGAPQIVASPATGNAGQAVIQQVGTMIGGAVYRLQCVVATSDGNQPSVWTHLACVAPQ